MIRRPRRLQALLPLAAMGDIAFLLIIFFILTSTFIEGDNAKLKPARSVDIEEVRKPAAYSVSVDTEGVVRLQGVVIPSGQLEASVDFLLGDRKDRRVKVSIDKDLTRKDFFPVVEALSRAGATPILTGELRGRSSDARRKPNFQPTISK